MRSQLTIRRWTAVAQLAGRMSQKVISRSLDLLYPPHCAFCQSEISVEFDAVLLCGDCRDLFVSTSERYCPRCGATVPTTELENKNCARCRESRYYFQHVVTLGTYRTELRHAILQIKRSREHFLAASLGGLVSLVRGEEIEKLGPDLIVPIPMHWRRRFVRGVNSSEWVAEKLSARLSRPMVPDVLFRIRNTIPQGRLSPPQRRGNVQGAFRCYPDNVLKQASVLLVDDIVTTGATCSEAAKGLLDAGARTVNVVALARSVVG